LTLRGLGSGAGELGPMQANGGAAEGRREACSVPGPASHLPSDSVPKIRHKTRRDVTLIALGSQSSGASSKDLEEPECRKEGKEGGTEGARAMKDNSMDLILQRNR